MIDEIINYIPYDDREKVEREIIISFLKNNKDAYSRESKLSHMTTSAWIVNQDFTKVLMIYHNIYKSWSWVGGHADNDTDLLHVIKKEINEETGLENIKLLSNGIYGLNILTVESHLKHGKIVNSHLHLDIEYLFMANENDFIRIKEDENSNIAWIPIDEVVNKTSEEKMKPIYEKLNKKLMQYKNLSN